MTTMDSTQVAAKSPIVEKRKRRDWTNGLLNVWGVLMYLFLFAPIFVIIAFSFNTGRLLTSWNGFGFEGYEAFFNNPNAQRAVWVSVQAGFMAALIATVLGTMAGIALARRPGKWVGIFLALVAVVLVTPEIVDAVGLLPWYVRLGEDWNLVAFGNGLVRLVISHAIFATAVVALIVRARLAGLDEALEESAADLYAPPFRRFTQITLPLVMPAVLAGALLSFTLSLDNTIISSFVSTPGYTPWPVYVFSSLRSALRPEIASVSTLMFALTLVAIGLVALVLRRGGDSSGDIAKTMTGT